MYRGFLSCKERKLLLPHVSKRQLNCVSVSWSMFMFWPSWCFQRKEELFVPTRILSGQNSKKSRFPKDGNFIVCQHRNVRREVM